MTADRVRHREHQRRYREVNPEKVRESLRRQYASLRDQVLDHYGRVCACPGCGAAAKLSIDHVNGDGRQHREELFGRNKVSTNRVYRWLVRNGFPPGFQVLCVSCNASKRLNSRCQIDHAATVALAEKRCLACRQIRPISEFHRDPRKKDGATARCRDCKNTDRRQQRGGAR